MNFITYECWKSRSFIDLCQGHLSSKHYKHLSPKNTTRLSDSTFHMNPIWDEKRNGSQMVIVKLPRWPPCSKMLKASKDLLQNYWANCLETGFVASGTVVLQNSYKTSSWVDLNLIYGKVNFGSICIFNRKSWNTYFLLLLYSRNMEMKWTASHMNARGQGHFRAVSPWTSDMTGEHLQDQWSFGLHMQK